MAYELFSQPFLDISLAVIKYDKSLVSSLEVIAVVLQNSFPEKKAHLLFFVPKNLYFYDGVEQ